MHPEIQTKAQCELDGIVGKGRLPDFDDYDSLPYVNAILLECLRWIPVLPLGLSHQLMADDYYEGYFIPEGTIIVPVSPPCPTWSRLKDCTEPQWLSRTHGSCKLAFMVKWH